MKPEGEPLEPSSLVSVGLNHLTASLSVRERTAILAEQLAPALSHLAGIAGLSEIVILSTCSRIELYGTARNPGFAAERLSSYLEQRAGRGSGAEITVRQGAQSIQHLFRVAAGLDSWIVGESEILAQVKRAYQAASDGRHTGRVLNRLFQRAIAAGKEVRAKTGIQDGIRSIGGAAAALAGRIFKDSERGRVLVFGAGEAAEAVARHLSAKSFPDLVFCSRTLERAQAAAEKLGGSAVTLEDGLKGLAEAEAAVFSLAAPSAVLRAAALGTLLKDRQRPLFLIDLGVPRNVEPSCAEQSGVYLYNLDDLKSVVADSMARKAAAKDGAELLAGERARECLHEIEKASRLQPAVAAGGAL